MNEERDQSVARELLPRIALRAAVLCAVMAAPFFLAPFSIASLAAIAVVGLHALWRLKVLRRESRQVRRQSRTMALLLLAFSSAGPLVAIGLMITLALAWLWSAYVPDVLTPYLSPYVSLAIAGLALLFVIVPAAFLKLAPSMARNDGGVASHFLAGVRAQGLSRFYRSWASSTAFAVGMFCMFYTVLAAARLRVFFALWRDPDGVVTGWELVQVFPFLPLSLVFSAVMLAVAWSLEVGAKESDRLVRAYAAGTKEQPRPKTGTRRVLGALAVCGYVAGLLLTLYPTHYVLVAEAARRSAGSWKAVAEVGRTLADRIRSDGWSETRVVAELNRRGFWTPDAPNEGLATLVSNPSELFSDSCTVRITAGLIDQTDREAAGGHNAGDPKSPVKFCTTMSCSPPVKWRAPRLLLLYSSHSSQSEYWAVKFSRKIFVDFLGEGRAPAPGGYCTETGDLANSYQG